MNQPSIPEHQQSVRGLIFLFTYLIFIFKTAFSAIIFEALKGNQYRKKIVNTLAFFC